MSFNFSTNNVCFEDTNQTLTDIMEKAPHRGEIVRAIVDKSILPITTICKMVSRSRAQIYTDFANPDMDWTLIKKIGLAIGHDFIKEFPDIDLYAGDIDDKLLNRSNPLGRAMSEVERWKSKAYENLDKANANMEEANKWKDMYYTLLLSTKKDK